MNLDVLLNGIDLEVGRDYYLLEDSRVVLLRPRPKVEQLTFWEKVQLVFKGQWGAAFTRREPYTDLVVIANWDRGWREVFVSGTKEFDQHICYQEDIQE